MGSSKLIHTHIALVSIFILISPSFSQHSEDPDALRTFIHDYVNKKIASESSMPRTGLIRNLTLPSSTIQVSVVRLRSGSLWARGQNISSFHVPPMIIPMPYVKRLVLVASNLHNLSSSTYFTPPQGFILASPVVGLAVYNASTAAFLSNTSIDINLTGGPITVTFENVKSASAAMCVGFSKDGAPSEVWSMTGRDECSVFSQGYTGIVVPESRHGNTRLSKRWLVAALCGILVVGILSFAGVFVWSMARRKRIKEMEMEMEMKSEKDVAVGTIWVGQSRLPAANMCRTQPQLESEMLP